MQRATAGKKAHVLIIRLDTTSGRPARFASCCSRYSNSACACASSRCSLSCRWPLPVAQLSLLKRMSREQTSQRAGEHCRV